MLISILLFVFFTITVADKDQITCPNSNGQDKDQDKDLAAKLKSKDFRSTLSPFALDFLKNINSTGFFKNLFDVSFSPAEVKQTFFDNCMYYCAQMGAGNPKPVCDGISEKADQAFQQNISPIDYFQIVANTLEGSLRVRGLLNSDNEDSLIKKFLKDVKQYLCARNVKGPVGALYSFTKGYIDFLKSLGIQKDDKIGFVGYLFGSEFEKYTEPSDIFVLLQLRNG